MLELTINGTGYSVYQHGSGDIAFVFLHYFGGASHAWQEVITLLGDSVHSIAPDLRGFGESDAPDAGYTVNDYSGDVAEIVKQLHIERYILVGHSMGGKIALFCAMTRPPGLVALVLLAPSPPTPEPMSDANRKRLLAGYGDRATSIETVQQITARPLSRAVLEHTIADQLRSSQVAWRAWLEHGSREDISAQISQINIPTFILSGACDSTIPPDVVEQEVATRIAGSYMSVVPDSGHLLPLEAPQAVVNLLQGVLQEVRASIPAPVALHSVGKTPAPHYPAGTVRALLDTDHLTPRTREVLRSRLAPGSPQAPRFFNAQAFTTLQAACSRLIPQAHRLEPVNLAGAIDSRLADGKGDGWRYDTMPPDGKAYLLGLRGLEESAHQQFSMSFIELQATQQDALLTAAQHDDLRSGVWEELPPQRFFEELLTELTECYYSDPLTQEEIGYVGMADAHGWQAIGLNQTELREPRESRDIHG